MPVSSEDLLPNLSREPSGSAAGERNAASVQIAARTLRYQREAPLPSASETGRGDHLAVRIWATEPLLRLAERAALDRAAVVVDPTERSPAIAATLAIFGAVLEETFVAIADPRFIGLA
jgi:hypothetical protein